MMSRSKFHPFFIKFGKKINFANKITNKIKKIKKKIISIKPKIDIFSYK